MKQNLGDLDDYQINISTIYEMDELNKDNSNNNFTNNNNEELFIDILGKSKKDILEILTEFFSSLNKENKIKNIILINIKD